MQAILDKVLKRIKPESKTKKELTREINDFLSKLKKKLKSAKVVAGGSFAKNTWKKDDFDVDVFVKFDMKHKKDNLSDLLQKGLKGNKFVRVHGSRDYFQIQKGKIKYEIVPVLNIRKNSDGQNVMDFSPLHVNWVKKSIGKLHDDIILAKQFCKANKIYGAESYIGGFSGHVIDILVIFYGGFIPLLRATKNWKEQKIVDVEKVYKGKALRYLNKSKTEGPLVVIDPVQPDRNAAAAVTKKTYVKFKKVAAQFLRKPNKKFFEEKKITLENLREKKAIIVEITPLTGKRDVVGTKLLKAYEFLKKHLKQFGIKESGWEWNDKVYFWFVLEKDRLDKEYISEGPPIEMKEAVKKFKKKHKRTFVKKGKLYAKVTQKNISIYKTISHLLKEKYFLSRIKSAQMGPKHL
ncbi:nucleotidyltransferase domain-containing protein [Nanoarchaeota archaeon]